MEGVLPHQSKNKRQFLHLASRQLELAEGGTAVSDWVLPHQRKEKRGFSHLASRGSPGLAEAPSGTVG